MKAKDKQIAKIELAIKALEYAQTQKLNINDKNDVKKILEIFDPLHASSKAVEEFMSLLQNTDTVIEMLEARRNSKKEKLPN